MLYKLVECILIKGMQTLMSANDSRRVILICHHVLEKNPDFFNPRIKAPSASHPYTYKGKSIPYVIKNEEMKDS